MTADEPSVFGPRLSPAERRGKEGIEAMDRSLLLNQLIFTERHISVHARHLLQQEAIVDDLERKGLDVAYAVSTLLRLQKTQAMLIADRDRMRAALRGSGVDSSS